MSRILPILALASFFTVAACAHKSEPVVITRDVNIAVPVPCAVELKDKRPALMTLPELQKQLAAAPDVDTKAKIVTAQLLAYMGWLPVVEGALQGCKMAPNPKND